MTASNKEQWAAVYELISRLADDREAAREFMYQTPASKIERIQEVTGLSHGDLVRMHKDLEQIINVGSVPWWWW